MAKDIQKTIPVRPAYQVNRGAVKVESGISTTYMATAIFDFAANDSAGVANSAIGTHGLNVFIPAKAIITRVWWQTVTGFTSAGSTATVALQAESAGDLKAATLVSNAAYVAAGFQDGVEAGAAANYVQATVERELKAVVAVQALTAGKLVLFVHYTLGL